MTTDLLEVRDHSELIALAKYLAIKTAQLIVQARNGSTVNTECTPKSVESYVILVNLAFPKNDEVEKDVKKTLHTMHSQDIWRFCIEIYLKTPDGDTMTLETWSVSILNKSCDLIFPNSAYSRIGIVLKSLIAISRAIPAYRYSRRQSPDSYFIGYRMYTGEPEYSALGDTKKDLIIGTMLTPVGTLQIDVAYRTSMTFSPQPSKIEDTSSIMVKSDHFKPDFSPKHNRTHLSDDSIASVLEDVNYKMGAFVDSRRDSLLESDHIIPTVPFGSLLSKASSQQSPTNVLSENELCERLKSVELNHKNNTVSENAVASKATSKDEIINENVAVSKTTFTTTTKTTTTATTTCCNDDFIMVELVKPPFAGSSGSIELGTFFQELMAAPPLQVCHIEDPKVIDQVGDLTSQLASYETSSKEFDSLVTSLCCENSNNEDTKSNES